MTAIEKQKKQREIILSQPMELLVKLSASGTIKDSSDEVLGQTLTCFVLGVNEFHGIAPWEKEDDEGNFPVKKWWKALIVVPTQGKHNDLFDQVSDRTLCSITKQSRHLQSFFDASNKIRANEDLEDMADELNEELGFSSVHPMRIQPWNLCPWVLSFRGKSNKHGDYAAMSWSLVDNPTTRQLETQLKVVRFYQQHFKQGVRPSELDIQYEGLSNLTCLTPEKKRIYKQMIGEQGIAEELNLLTSSDLQQKEPVTINVAPM